MKNQALFSSKDKSKKLKCRLLQLLFCALRVKANGYTFRKATVRFCTPSRQGSAKRGTGLLFYEQILSFKSTCTCCYPCERLRPPKRQTGRFKGSQKEIINQTD